MELRMYCIVNQYIAGIHAGIQSAHAITELLNHYGVQNKGNTNARVTAQQWAEEFKTIIVLDGGYQSNLKRILLQMEEVEDLPSHHFCETEDALNGALTAICMVLPEYMYNPQYAEISNMAYRPGQLNLSEVADVWKDPLTGAVRHKYTEQERSLIGMIKALRLKGA